METVSVKEVQFTKSSDVTDDQIRTLADSITEQGLIHPITVQKLNTSGYRLVTGMKRLLAFILLELPEIPADVRDDNLTDDDIKEIHLHENLKRAQLPWYDEVTLVKELHELRQKQHGASQPYRPKDSEKKGWGVRDTANELGKALGGVSEDLQLARMVQQSPSLRNIKDKSTAIKVVKQTAKRIFAEEEATVSGDVPFADEIFLGDASSILEQFPENTFDFCITDPPWLKFRDESLRRDEFTLPVFKALYRVMKYDSFMYMFVGEDDFHYYKEKLPEFKWRVQGHPCIWQKLSSLSRTGVRQWEHGRDLELILLAVKGNPVLTSPTQVSSVFTHAVVSSKMLTHPNEKPLGLIENMLRFISYEGSLGVDPFSGSGAHLEAMKNKKRHYVGIERDPDFYKKIQNRPGLYKKEKK